MKDLLVFTTIILLIVSIAVILYAVLKVHDGETMQAFNLILMAIPGIAFGAIVLSLKSKF